MVGRRCRLARPIIRNPFNPRVLAPVVPGARRISATPGPFYDQPGLPIIGDSAEEKKKAPDDERESSDLLKNGVDGLPSELGAVISDELQEAGTALNEVGHGSLGSARGILQNKGGKFLFARARARIFFSGAVRHRKAIGV